MTDSDLLEMAAKAAGVAVWWFENGETFCLMGNHTPWNPLRSDGDALRLAVKLRLEIINDDYMVIVRQRNPHKHGAQESLSTDRYASTRRAIVRAAAAIGSAM